MRGEIEREIKGTDKRAWTNRNAFPHPAIALGSFGYFKVHYFASDPHRFFGGDPKRVNQTRNFASRILDRLARFDTQRHRQFIEPLGKSSNAVIEHALAFVRAHFREGFCRGNTANDSLFDRLRVGECNPSCDVTGELVRHFQVVIGFAGFVGDVVGPVFFDRHF